MKLYSLLEDVHPTNHILRLCTHLGLVDDKIRYSRVWISNKSKETMTFWVKNLNYKGCFPTKRILISWQNKARLIKCNQSHRVLLSLWLENSSSENFELKWKFKLPSIWTFYWIECFENDSVSNPLVTGLWLIYECGYYCHLIIVSCSWWRIILFITSLKWHHLIPMDYSHFRPIHTFHFANMILRASQTGYIFQCNV